MGDDDDRSARVLLERVISRAGHTVVCVEDAEAGLIELARVPFDVLITDKNLPGVDGLEVLKVAREKNPRTRAIIVTGFPNEETKRAAAHLGVHAYVAKPFGVHDILDLVDAAVRAAQALP